MSQTIEQLITRWNSGDGKPYKGSLIDRDAYEKNPDSPGCMCAQGQVLHYVAGWEVERLSSTEQIEADKAVAELLGISRGHAILLRHVNDKIDGAPAIVLTHPEKVLGEHAQLVLTFFKYLDSMDRKAWSKFFAAGYATRYAARIAAGEAAWNAAGYAAREAALEAARYATGYAACKAAWNAAGYAALEIQGHKILAKKGRPLFFLGLFGFKNIEALQEWAA